MIAAMIRGGRSSNAKHTLDYVLHDKDGIGTERVGEVRTLNLASRADQAHTEIQTTAEASKAIQARARAERGERAGGSGSRAEKTVFHYALSFHPDDHPTTEQMFEAGHATLKRLGLDAHQVVMAQHLDKGHPHLHVVCGIHNPNTGLVHSLYQNVHVLNRWAHEYEQSRQTIRTWNRHAKFSREHEWKRKEPKMAKEAERKQKAAEQKKAPQWELYKERKRELWTKQQAEKVEIKKRQEQRHEALERKIADVRRQAALDRKAAKKRHEEQLKEYRERDAPKMKLEPRPNLTKQLMSEGAVMADAIKQLRPVVYPGKVFVERRTEDRRQNTPPNKGPAAKERAEPQPRTEFQDRSEISQRNQVRAQGIEDRYEGELQIKRWQRQVINEIDNKKDEAIRAIHDQIEQDRETNRREWQEHKERFERLREELRVECNIPEKTQEIERDQYGNEIIDMSGPVEPEADPPPLQPDPPSYEPELSWYEPDRERPAPEPDLDWEIGD